MASIGNCEGQVLELGCQVDADERDPLWERQRHGSKVHDAGDSSRDQLIGHVLSLRRRDGDHAKLDAQFSYQVAELPRIVDEDSFNLRSHDAGVEIERRHDAKALRGEALVTQQGPAHVADADQRDDPLSVGAQDAANLSDQLAASVANAWMPEMAEIGEVLADLGVGEAQHLTELTGTDRGTAVPGQVLQFT